MSTFVPSPGSQQTVKLLDAVGKLSLSRGDLLLVRLSLPEPGTQMNLNAEAAAISEAVSRYRGFEVPVLMLPAWADVETLERKEAEALHRQLLAVLARPAYYICRNCGSQWICDPNAEELRQRRPDEAPDYQHAMKACPRCDPIRPGEALLPYEKERQQRQARGGMCRQCGAKWMQPAEESPRGCLECLAGAPIERTSQKVGPVVDVEAWLRGER